MLMERRGHVKRITPTAEENRPEEDAGKKEKSGSPPKGGARNIDVVVRRADRAERNTISKRTSTSARKKGKSASWGKKAQAGMSLRSRSE